MICNSPFRFLLIALCFITSFGLFGQTDYPLPENGDEEIPVFEINPIHPVKENACLSFFTRHHDVIRCSSAATFLGKLSLNFFDEGPEGTLTEINELEMEFLLNEIPFTATVENRMLIIADLPIDQNFQLSAFNSCGDSYVLTYFDTYVDESSKEKVNVSREFANFLTPWGEEADGSLYDYVVADESLNKYEKIAFIQDYFYEGQPISDEFCGEIPPSTPPPAEFPNGACGCKWTVNAYDSVQPNDMHKAAMANQKYYGGIWPVGGDAPVKRDISGGEGVQAWQFAIEKGPAVHREHWANAFRDDRGVLHRDSLNIDVDPEAAITSNNAQIFYQLICTTEDGLYTTEIPEDCHCEKSLEVNWHYNSYVEAKANTLSGGGTKSAYSQAEDFAMVTVKQEGQEMTLLDAGRVGTSANCDAGINPQPLIGYAQFAIGVAQAAIGFSQNNMPQVTTTTGTGGGSTGLGTRIPTNFTRVDTTIRWSRSTRINYNPGNSLINSAANNIVQGLTNFITGLTEGIKIGECGQSSNESVLLDNSQSFTIEPNKGITVSLSSAQASMVAGKWKFSSHTLVASEFSLAAKIPENISNKDSDCCSPVMANFLTASFRKFPSVTHIYNNDQARNSVKNFFRQEPVWNNLVLNTEHDWAHIIGPNPPGCDQITEVVFNLRENSEEGAPMPNFQFNYFQTSEGIMIEVEEKNGANQEYELHYSLVTKEGLFVGEGVKPVFVNSTNFLSYDELIPYSNNRNLELYFLRIGGYDQFDTFKFIR